MKYRDPHAIALLILELKTLLGCDYHEKFEDSYYKEIAKRSNFELSSESAKGFLGRFREGTFLLRIYFAGTPYLNSFTSLVGKGTWDEFRNSIESVVVGFSANSPVGLKPMEACKFYEENIYNKWKDRIEEAIGVKEKNNEGSEIAIEAQESSKSKIGSNQRSDLLPRPLPPLLVGEERIKGLEAQANYLIKFGKPLVIIGMAGCGKSNFVENLIEQVSLVQTYQERRFIIYCDELLTYSAFLLRLGNVIGMPDLNVGENIEKSIIEYFARLSGRNLLIVDNFDTCYEGYFDELKDFFKGLQQYVTLVYTMRTHVSLQEVDWNIYRLPELACAEAVEIFNYYSNDKFAEGEENLRHINYLVGDDIAGYLPLAVKLMAKQAERVRFLRDLRSEWAQRGIEIIQIDGPKNDRRSNDLLYSISLSFESARLDDEDRLFLKALCDFPSSIRSGRSSISQRISNGFNKLNRLSLVALVAESDEGDLIVHPVVRLYMKNITVNSACYRDIVAKYYCDQAANCHREVGAVLDAITFTKNNWENIHRSFVILANDKDCINSICAVASISRVLDVVDKIEMLLKESVKIANSNEWYLEEVKCLRCLGDIAMFRDNNNEALKCYEAAMTVSERITSSLGMAISLEGLGKIEFWSASIVKAAEYCTDALSLYRENESKLGEANCLLLLGNIEFVEGNSQLAETHREEAWSIYQQIHDMIGEADILYCLAESARRFGEIKKSDEYYQESRELYHQLTVRSGEASCLVELGNLAFLRGAVDQAVERYNEAIELFQLWDDRLGEAEALRCLSNIDFIRFDTDVAMQRNRSAVDLLQQKKNILGEAKCLEVLGFFERSRNKKEEALSHFENSLSKYRQAERPLLGLGCIKGIGELLLDDSSFDEAMHYINYALSLYCNSQDVEGEANCLLKLGEIYTNFGSIRQASEYYKKSYYLFYKLECVSGMANYFFGVSRINPHDYQMGKSSNLSYALEYYQKSQQRLGEAKCLHRLGDIDYNFGDFDESIRHYKEAEKLYSRVNRASEQADCMYKLAMLYINVDKFKLAEGCAIMAMGWYASFKDKLNYGFCSVLIANVCEKNYQEEKITKHFCTARRAWLDIGREDLVQEFIPEKIVCGDFHPEKMYWEVIDGLREED